MRLYDEKRTSFKLINEGDSISVTDSSGEVIYQGRINYNGNLIRLFDFSQLNDGVYTVEISKDFEIEILNLNVKNKEVTLLTDSQEKIFKPVFRTENSKIIMTCLNFARSDPTANNRPIHSKSFYNIIAVIGQSTISKAI